jgi:VWFA-related protein
VDGWAALAVRRNQKEKTTMSRTFRATLAALSLSAVAAWGLSPAARAQDRPQEQKPQAEFKGEVNVNEVLLDVLVTDAKGNVIVGLDKNDFVVKENGKPVDLTGVTFYSNRRLIESSEAVAKKGIQVDRVPEDRYFVLFFHDMKDAAVEAPRLLSQQMDAVQRARDWVQSGMLPNDHVAVVSYDKKLKVQQDFTSDRRGLATAIGNAMKGKDVEANWPSRVDPAKGPSLAAGLPVGNALRDKTTNVYDALRVLAQAARPITGRKNVLLFTIGFGQSNSFGQFIPDPRYYPRTMQALNDANVAVYPIDLTPSGTQNFLADPMTQLAEDTGGRYMFNFTSFTTPLKQVSEENSGYYLLSYQGSHPVGKSGFQNVQITTTNPEFRVRTRKGYAFGAS